MRGQGRESTKGTEGREGQGCGKGVLAQRIQSLAEGGRASANKGREIGSIYSIVQETCESNGLQ